MAAGCWHGCWRAEISPRCTYGFHAMAVAELLWCVPQVVTGMEIVLETPRGTLVDVLAPAAVGETVILMTPPVYPY